MVSPEATPTGDRPRLAGSYRLNLLHFPSNTDFFFGLLVFAVIAFSLDLHNMLFLWNSTSGGDYLRQTTACMQQFGNPGTRDLFSADPNQPYRDCIAPVEQKRAGAMLDGVLPVLVLAGLITWFTPLWIIRRGRLVPITREDLPDLIDGVGGLCQKIGLTRQPRLYWNPMDLSTGGMAFGRAGSYAVRLSGGLVSQFFTAPERFSAVMLHELAHIRTKDIDKTYLTMGLWYAFLVGTLAPFAISLFQTPFELAADIAWRIGLLALLVYLIRNMVLRSREHTADLLAYQHSPAQSSLKELLNQLPTPRFGAILSTHPRPAQRITLLDQPLRLYQQDWIIPLATGLLVGLGYEPVMGFLSATSLANTNLLAILTGFVVGPLVMAIVGLGVWRSAFVRLFEPSFTQETSYAGFGLAIGSFIGREFSPRGLAIFQYGDRIDLWLVSALLWVVVIGLSLSFLFRWVARGAELWLRAALQETSLAPTLAWGSAAGALVLSTWLGLAFFIYYLLDTTGFDPAASRAILGALTDRVLGSPVTLLILATLWALPLSAFAVRRKQITDHSTWAFQELPGDGPIPVTTSTAPAVSLWPAVLAALALGLAATVLIVAVRLGLRLVLSEEARGQAGFQAMLYNAYLALAVLVQIGCAAWITWRSRHARTAQGLFGAFFCGVFITGGLLLSLSGFGGQISPEFALFLLCNFTNTGCLAALPFTGLIQWLVKHRRTERQANMAVT